MSPDSIWLVDRVVGLWLGVHIITLIGIIQVFEKCLHSFCKVFVPNHVLKICKTYTQLE